MITEPKTLLMLLKDAAERCGEATIYRFLTTGEAAGPQETLSASGLAMDARKIGGALSAVLRRHGEGPHRVALASWSPIEFARAFFGCLFAGSIPVPVYPPPIRASAAGIAGLKSIIDDARPSILIGDAASVSAIRDADPGLGATCPLFSTAELSMSDSAPLPGSPSSTAYLQYTSGSTGAPRGVMISHGNILPSLRSIAAAVAPPPGAVAVSWLPLSHDLGLVGNLLLALYTGSAELVLMTPHAFVERPARWLQAISRFRAWGTSAPNFAFALCNRMIRKKQAEDLDLSSLESVLCGGDPIDAATLERFAHRFAPQGFRRDSLRPCYGLVEATLFVSLTRLHSLSAKAFDSAALHEGRLQEADGNPHGRAVVSCGITQPELDAVIVDPETERPLQAGEIGEIWVSGVPVAGSYAGNGDRRYLRTGDLGALYDGELYVTGRRQEILRVHGLTYNAHDLERIAAASHPHLRAEGVVVFAGSSEGDRIIVLAEAAPGAPPEVYRLVARLIRSRLGKARGLWPDVIVLAPPRSIAVTSSGKLRRGETRRRYETGLIVPLFTDVGPHDAEDCDVADLIEKVLLREVKIAARCGEQEPLPHDVRLSELGIDSSGVAQIAASIGDFLDCDVPLTAAGDDPCITTLIERFKAIAGGYRENQRRKILTH